MEAPAPLLSVQSAEQHWSRHEMQHVSWVSLLDYLGGLDEGSELCVQDSFIARAELYHVHGERGRCRFLTVSGFTLFVLRIGICTKAEYLVSAV